MYTEYCLYCVVLCLSFPHKGPTTIMNMISLHVCNGGRTGHTAHVPRKTSQMGMPSMYPSSYPEYCLLTNCSGGKNGELISETNDMCL